MKTYENVTIKVLVFPVEDIIATSFDDESENVGGMPDFE